MASVLLTSKFYALAAERAIKTAAQTALALFGAEAFNVLEADWVAVGSVATGAAVLSVLSSVASIPVGDNNDPSVV